ncbi:FAD-dependent oxidoreductase [Noviherbaspirillum agri]
MDPASHKVVIVGGGAGGLELAAKLGRRFGPAHVTLVDRQTYHIWKPSLHEVAAGTLDVHREGLSYAMLAKDSGFTFIPGEVDDIDRGQKLIRLGPLVEGGEEILPKRTVRYDTLVLAIGSKANFFGTPGAAEHAVALDSTEQAERFRLKLLRELSEADRQKAGSPERVLNLAIVGGGATGVELAAELTEAFVDLAYYGLTHLDPKKDIRITILEGGPRILPPLPEKLSAAAHGLLAARGVAVRTSVRVAKVTGEALYDDKGNRYPADLCVWAAGIEAPALLAQLGLETNRVNQLVVDASLRTNDPAVYAFGDCAAAPWGDEGKTLPARAQVAHQQASFLVPMLAERIQGRPVTPRRFQFHDRGSLVSIGTSQGVGSLMGVLSGRKFFVHGIVGRLMYMSLHLLHHQAFLGTARTMLLALARLLMRRGEPRVKLH